MSHRLSTEFQRLADVCKGKDLTLKELVALLDVRAEAFIILILALPFVCFIFLPGLSIIFGSFIFLNGIRIATRRPLWFPHFLLKRKMSGSTLAKGFVVAEKLVKRVEKFIKPRGHFLIQHPQLQVFHGCILAICGFLCAIPLPPGTNFLPGLTAVLISIGILEEDGLFIVFGYVTFILTLAFFTILPFYGFKELFVVFKKRS